MKKNPTNIKSVEGYQLRVEFDNGEVMYVSKNPNNAVRRKLEREYPDIYPTARS